MRELPPGSRGNRPMNEPARPGRTGRVRHRRGLPVLLVSLAAIGAAQAAAWLYFRKNQPVTDELTRDRLEPRSRS